MKRYIALTLALMLTSNLPAAGPLRDRLAAMRSEMEEEGAAPFALPDGVRLLADQPYGAHRQQRYDVYLPANAERAPVIFMVHGGAWRTGDKASAAVVQNKVRRWTARGIIVVSVNYRLLPGASVAAQAADVAGALAAVQGKAAGWGGDRGKFVLMGHSAGAHLVALLASAPVPAGVTPWLGTVALDSAAMDVPALMAQRHFPFYDAVFGGDAAYWRTVSPLAQLTAGGMPLLAVCSSRRQDSCSQAEGYAARANALGMRVQVLPQNLSHREINATLGQAGTYTSAVETFLASLDAVFAAKLM
ncbi:alpha/beta hydrolase fold domain-containing protein [Pseudoduganella sp. FT26W]|uniref:Alpha/beta hydrolase fold domain-containing protein n=1 Tax=Duganella aquatilis TaxID=2666082 RepID=A0A844DH11_9BURK|nr:alpha/beta hydrolase [Duganella aquatilis]MRW87749.1 alpha/beta hydrolase fold domain-containing protein [Duganella aquatilis]